MGNDRKRTNEAGDAGGGIYVIQKHDARTLHYDFRLEVDGVLVSWAVPKGPSLNPAQKRLAIKVEDHPRDYAEFEGTIPEDEYGGGTVMVWDTGTYNNIKDLSLDEALSKGRLEIVIEGKKLRGKYAVIRTGAEGTKNWLLIKMKDEHARREGNVTEEEPRSAKTGRTMEEIAAEEPL
jgi:DNA ligase D-like protein (predicted 3'-phosphoesterase)